MKKGFLLLLLLFFAVVSGAQVRGVIQVKLQEGSEQQVEPAIQAQAQAQRASAVPVPLQVGIQRFDALSVRFGTTSMRRIFPDAGEYEALHRKAGLHLWYEVCFDEDADVEEAVAEYSKIGEIASAGKVYPVKRITGVAAGNTVAAQAAEALPVPATMPVDDPLFSKQWNFNNTGQERATSGVDINLPEGWDYTMGSEEVIVAVVDGGIDVNHPDLKDAIWSGVGKNFVNASHGVTPDDHGTHVAGVIAAMNNNGTGVAGIAGGFGGPGSSIKGVRLMSCQIFEGEDSAANLGDAIVYAADSGAVICQNSWGYEKPDEYNDSDIEAIRYFINNAGKLPDGSPRPGTKMNGGIVIFAAGNEKSDKKWYPAYLDEVTSVSAIGYDGKKASYSNYGTWVDVAAPGGDASRWWDEMILSAIPTSSTYSYTEDAGYGWMQGTSMACPHVSGVAALILSRYGSASYTPAMLRNRLIDSTTSLTAYDPTYASRMGKGLLNAERALWGAPIRALSVAINDCAAVVPVGSTWTLSATVLPEIAINRNVIFTSSDSSIIALREINGQTVATGLVEGDATITVTTVDVGLENVCPVRVVIPVEGVTIEPRVARLQTGDTLRFKVTIHPDTATIKNVAWHVNNPNVAQLDNGRVAIRSGGSPGNPKKATVTVTTENGSYTSAAEIYAYSDVYAPEGFSPNGDGVNDELVFALNPNENYTLTVFDRSGQVHFRSGNYQNNWDGTANTGPCSGNKLPANTYLYVLSTPKAGQEKRGFIVIKY